MDLDPALVQSRPQFSPTPVAQERHPRHAVTSISIFSFGSLRPATTIVRAVAISEKLSMALGLHAASLPAAGRQFHGSRSSRREAGVPRGETERRPSSSCPAAETARIPPGRHHHRSTALLWCRPARYWHSGSPCGRRWSNNRAEVSHQPTRQRERQRRRFRSPGLAQRFLATHAAVYNHFNVP